MDARNLPDRIEKKAIDAIERILKSRLRQMGFKSADIYAGQDHDGEPVIYVDAQHKYVAKPINLKTADDLVTEVRDALEAIGETRFPHVRLHFDERQEVAQST